MSSAESVKSVVSDPKLVEERRHQIIRAATKLFSEEGYYTTTILQIAREAKVSTGLIYQYFGDKDDILFLTLKQVLDTYENEIPRQIEGLTHPVERLCRAIWAYCAIVDAQRDATVLAYRSTKSLRADRRGLIMDGETRTNRLIEKAIRACTTGGFMRPINEHLLSYQCVTFAHAWALKYWAFRDRYTLAEYVDEGLQLMVEPFLTTKGKTVLTRIRQSAAEAGTEHPAPAAATALAAPAGAKSSND